MRSSPQAPSSRNRALPQQLGFITKSIQKVARISPSKGTPLPEAPQRLIGNDRPFRIIETIWGRGASKETSRKDSSCKPGPPARNVLGAASSYHKPGLGSSPQATSSRKRALPQQLRFISTSIQKWPESILPRVPLWLRPATE